MSRCLAGVCKKDENMWDMILLGAVFLDQEFRFMESVEQGEKHIVELAFRERKGARISSCLPEGVP